MMKNADKMTSRRVACVDCGIRFSGVCVMDMPAPPLQPKIIMMELVKDKPIDEFVADTVIPMLLEHANPFFVYENMMMPFAKHKGRVPIRVQKAVRAKIDVYKNRVAIKALQPAQKHLIGAVVKDRKKLTVEAARGYIKARDPTWLPVFDGLSRQHDVADSVLMGLYVYHNL